MSLKSIMSIAVLSVMVASGAQAQAPKPDFDAVPDKMPFDVPYGAPISLEHANAVLNAAVAESKKRSWKMNCAVLDSGANLVAFQRMDGAQLGSIDIALHKARAAVKFRRESKVFENAIHAGINYVMTLDDMIGSRGGIPLIEGGKMIGSVGCSGGTGSQDEVIAKAGAALVK